MSAHEEEMTGEVEIGANEVNEEDNVRFSPDIFDERIKVNLEPLHAQISVLTEMIDRRNLRRQVPANYDINPNRLSPERREPLVSQW